MCSPMYSPIYSPQILTDLSPGPNTCGSIAADPDRAQGLAAVTGKANTQEPAQSRRAGGSTLPAADLDDKGRYQNAGTFQSP